MASTTSTPTASTVPAVEQLLPYLKSGLSAASTGISAVSHLATVVFTKFSPLPVLLYVFAPPLVLLETVFEVLVQSPYQLALYCLDVFYPVYVFCGAACITGGMLGLAGRVISSAVVSALEEKPVEEPEARTGMARKGKTKMKAST